MHRRFALRAEVFQIFRDAGAEQLTPHAIHKRSGGERIRTGNQPVREIETRGSLATGFELAQEFGNGRLHDVAGIIHPVAAWQDAHFARLHRLGDHDFRYLTHEDGAFRFQFRELDSRRFELRIRILEVIEHQLLLVFRTFVRRCKQRRCQIGCYAIVLRRRRGNHRGIKGGGCGLRTAAGPAPSASGIGTRYRVLNCVFATGARP